MAGQKYHNDCCFKLFFSVWVIFYLAAIFGCFVIGLSSVQAEESLVSMFEPEGGGGGGTHDSRR